ncbi:MAG: hypothetical protein ACYDDI_13680 [Candidatus Acidiferrales bacterium]
MTSAIFAGLDEHGSVYIRSIDIEFDRHAAAAHEKVKVFDKVTVPPIGHTMVIGSIGMPEIVNEFSTQSTARAKKEKEQWQLKNKSFSEEERDISRIIRFVQLTIDLHPEKWKIGGQIDTVEIKRGV